MKIDRSLDSAKKVVESSAKSSTSNSQIQKLSEELLIIGFENQFERVERAKVRDRINALLDELKLDEI